MKTILLKAFDLLNIFSLFNRYTKERASVFMLHHLGKSGERRSGYLAADILDKELEYLVRHGYTVLSVSGYLERLFSRSVGLKSVVFTIDDGYRDFYEYGYPVFKKHKLPAGVFIVSDFIDGRLELWWDKIKRCIRTTELCELRISHDGHEKFFSLRSEREKEKAIVDIIEWCKKLPEDQKEHIIRQLAHGTKQDSGYRHEDGVAMSWHEIKEMQEHSIEFFPHTKTHPILMNISAEEKEKEISESKMIIEQNICKPANVFCYPNGKFEDVSNEIISLLKKKGYIASFTAEEGFDAADGDVDFFRLKRYPLPSDLLLFKEIVSGLETFITQLWE